MSETILLLAGMPFMGNLALFFVLGTMIAIIGAFALTVLDATKMERDRVAYMRYSSIVEEEIPEPIVYVPEYTPSWGVRLDNAVVLTIVSLAAGQAAWKANIDAIEAIVAGVVGVTVTCATNFIAYVAGRTVTWDLPTFTITIKEAEYDGAPMEVFGFLASAPLDWRNR